MIPLDAAALQDAEGWQRLERTLRPFVAKRVKAADVDDVLQESLLRIHRGASTLKNDQRFGPWVYRIVRNAIVDHARREARHPPPPHEGLAPRPEPEHDAEEEGAPLAAAVAAAFVRFLPDAYRDAIRLTELEGLSQQEAADQLGISLTAMKSRARRGRKRLRDDLEACCTFSLDARKRVLEMEARSDGKLPKDGCECSKEDVD